MFRTRWTTVLACLIAPAVVTWVVSDLSLRHHGWVPSLTPWGAVVALVISVIVFIAGLAVRRLRAHEPTWITPTGAATTAVAAQASAIVGALVGGVYARWRGARPPAWRRASCGAASVCSWSTGAPSTWMTTTITAGTARSPLPSPIAAPLLDGLRSRTGPSPGVPPE